MPLTTIPEGPKSLRLAVPLLPMPQPGVDEVHGTLMKVPAKRTVVPTFVIVGDSPDKLVAVGMVIVQSAGVIPHGGSLSAIVIALPVRPTSSNPGDLKYMCVRVHVPGVVTSVSQESGAATQPPSASAWVM